MNDSLNTVLSSSPSTIIKSIPVTTNNTVLPFSELAWEDFEKFCFQLGCKTMDCLESSYIYGRKGQAQDGIDLYFRKDGKTIVWQIKRYASFCSVDITNAVNTFLAGQWLKKSNTFILCVSCYLDDTKIVNEIDTQSKALEKKHVKFGMYNSEKLTIMAENFPELIEKFFGSAWKNAIISSKSEEAKQSTEWYFEDGTIVDNKKIYSTGNMSVKIDDTTICAEHQMPDGKTMYAEIDAKNSGIVRNAKFPYPLSEYHWDIPSDLVLNESKSTQIIDSKQHIVITTNLKWKGAIYRVYYKNELIDMTINSPVFIDNTSKIIHIKKEH